MAKKILVIDDSALMRRVISDIINESNEYEVAAIARDGVEGFDLIVSNPNLYAAIILDINMPKMNGLELLDRLQKNRIKQTVIVVSTVAKNGAKETIQALELGAFDFVTKPEDYLETKGEQFKVKIQEMLDIATAGKSGSTVSKTESRSSDRTASRSTDRSLDRNRTGYTDRISTRDSLRSAGTDSAASATRNRLGSLRRSENLGTGTETSNSTGANSTPARNSGIVDAVQSRLGNLTTRSRSLASAGADLDRQSQNSKDVIAGIGQVSPGKNKLVALACSTGGPKSLQQVIPLLPANLDAAVVLVQHMPKGFTASLAQRLDEISKVHVKEAEDGDVITNGNVYIAPGGMHMRVVTNGSKHAIKLSDEPAIDGLRPCANIMYESIASCKYDQITCVVLTGMGADGTKGIKALSSRKNIHVIAQDEETCVVYGMPKAIAQSGLTDEVVPLQQIAETITKNVGVS